eukprot:3044256-Rhodomonas_salina.1
MPAIRCARKEGQARTSSCESVSCCLSCEFRSFNLVISVVAPSDSDVSDEFRLPRKVAPCWGGEGWPLNACEVFISAFLWGEQQATAKDAAMLLGMRILPMSWYKSRSEFWGFSTKSQGMISPIVNLQRLQSCCPFRRHFTTGNFQIHEMRLGASTTIQDLGRNRQPFGRREDLFRRLPAVISTHKIIHLPPY